MQIAQTKRMQRLLNGPAPDQRKRRREELAAGQEDARSRQPSQPPQRKLKTTGAAPAPGSSALNLWLPLTEGSMQRKSVYIRHEQAALLRRAGCLGPEAVRWRVGADVAAAGGAAAAPGAAAGSAGGRDNPEAAAAPAAAAAGAGQATGGQARTRFIGFEPGKGSRNTRLNFVPEWAEQHGAKPGWGFLLSRATGSGGAGATAGGGADGRAWSPEGAMGDAGVGPAGAGPEPRWVATLLAARPLHCDAPVPGHGADSPARPPQSADAADAEAAGVAAAAAVPPARAPAAAAAPAKAATAPAAQADIVRKAALAAARGVCTGGRLLSPPPAVRGPRQAVAAVAAAAECSAVGASCTVTLTESGVRGCKISIPKTAAAALVGWPQAAVGLPTGCVLPVWLQLKSPTGRGGTDTEAAAADGGGRSPHAETAALTPEVMSLITNSSRAGTNRRRAMGCGTLSTSKRVWYYSWAENALKPLLSKSRKSPLWHLTCHEIDAATTHPTTGAAAAAAAALVGSADISTGSGVAAGIGAGACASAGAADIATAAPPGVGAAAHAPSVSTGAAADAVDGAASTGAASEPAVQPAAAEEVPVYEQLQRLLDGRSYLVASLVWEEKDEAKDPWIPGPVAAIAADAAAEEAAAADTTAADGEAAAGAAADTAAGAAATASNGAAGIYAGAPADADAPAAAAGAEACATAAPLQASSSAAAGAGALPPVRGMAAAAATTPKAAAAAATSNVTVAAVATEREVTSDRTAAGAVAATGAAVQSGSTNAPPRAGNVSGTPAQGCAPPQAGPPGLLLAPLPGGPKLAGLTAARRAAVPPPRPAPLQWRPAAFVTGHTDFSLDPAPHCSPPPSAERASPAAAPALPRAPAAPAPAPAPITRSDVVAATRAGGTAAFTPAAAASAAAGLAGMAADAAEAAAAAAVAVSEQAASPRAREKTPAALQSVADANLFQRMMSVNAANANAAAASASASDALAAARVRSSAVLRFAALAPVAEPPPPRLRGGLPGPCGLPRPGSLLGPGAVPLNAVTPSSALAAAGVAGAAQRPGRGPPAAVEATGGSDGRGGGAGSSGKTQWRIPLTEAAAMAGGGYSAAAAGGGGLGSGASAGAGGSVDRRPQELKRPVQAVLAEGTAAGNHREPRTAAAAGGTEPDRGRPAKLPCHRVEPAAAGLGDPTSTKGVEAPPGPRMRDAALMAGCFGGDAKVAAVAKVNTWQRVQQQQQQQQQQSKPAGVEAGSSTHTLAAGDAAAHPAAAMMTAAVVATAATEAAAAPTASQGVLPLPLSHQQRQAEQQVQQVQLEPLLEIGHVRCQLQAALAPALPSLVRACVFFWGPCLLPVTARLSVVSTGSCTTCACVLTRAKLLLMALSKLRLLQRAAPCLLLLAGLCACRCAGSWARRQRAGRCWPPGLLALGRRGPVMKGRLRLVRSSPAAGTWWECGWGTLQASRCCCHSRKPSSAFGCYTVFESLPVAGLLCEH